MAELLTSPFIPSNTARGGGIISPVALSLAHSLKSRPNSNPAPGQFLMLTASHANLITASMFLTGAAVNPIIRAEARKVFGVDFGWSEWFIGAIVPGSLSLLLMPIVCWIVTFWSTLATSTAADGELLTEARRKAKKELMEMGDFTPNEKFLAFVLCLCVLCWSTAPLTGLDASAVAFTAMAVLLLADVLQWRLILENHSAWNTFFWLGGFIALAEQFSLLQITAFVGSNLSYLFDHTRLQAIALPILGIIYFTTVTMFVSISAHAVVFAGIMMETAHRCGAAPMQTVALVAYFTALCAALTNYSTGTVVIYYAHGYVSREKWYVTGGCLSAMYFVIYYTLGLLWWWLLGWE